MSLINGQALPWMCLIAAAAAAESQAWRACRRWPSHHRAATEPVCPHHVLPLQRTKSTTLGTKLVVPKPVNLPSKKKVGWSLSAATANHQL